MQDKEIRFTHHSIKRGRKRFKLNKKALLRMVKKSIKEGIVIPYKKCVLILYAQFKFVTQLVDDYILVITISNFHDLQAYKQEKTIPLYNKGKKTKNTMIIRGCN